LAERVLSVKIDDEFDSEAAERKSSGNRRPRMSLRRSAVPIHGFASRRWRWMLAPKGWSPRGAARSGAERDAWSKRPNRRAGMHS
jgi:hypothetical protein